MLFYLSIDTAIKFKLEVIFNAIAFLTSYLRIHKILYLKVTKKMPDLLDISR